MYLAAKNPNNCNRAADSKSHGCALSPAPAPNTGTGPLAALALPLFALAALLLRRRPNG